MCIITLTKHSHYETVSISVSTMEKNMNEQIARKLYTKKKKVILASSSEVRNKMLNKYFSNVVRVSHKIEEEKFKIQKKKPEEIVLNIAKEKALSVVKDFGNEMIIASDQILICENKIWSKPKTLEAAKEKLLFLKNKIHKLFSSIYVIQNQKLYFQQVKAASLFFSNISQKDIETYIRVNKKTVLTTVGSYKIEENAKYNFIRIVKGDIETILGFPIKDLIEKIRHEK